MTQSHSQPSLWDELTSGEVDDSQLVDDHSDDEVADNELVIQQTNLDDVEVRRSSRRKKSAAAFRENGKTVVVVPARMSKRDVDEFVKDLVGRLDARDEKESSRENLEKRAAQLVAKYLDHDVIGQHRVPVSIRWVTNQNSRWGSCTPADGNIRLSHRLREMPSYVIDCVLLHELIHLVVPDHSKNFYEFMNRFDDLERASAFLAGYAHAEQHRV